MSGYMKDILVTAIIVFGLTFSVSTIAIVTYLGNSDNEGPKIECVKAGSSWVIDDQSDADDPNYECIKP